MEDKGWRGDAGPVDTSAAVYRERSPLYHIEKFNCPIVLFQGLKDRVRGEGLRTLGFFFGVFLRCTLSLLNAFYTRIGFTCSLPM